MEQFTFFWRGPFSQWWKSPFEYDNMLFTHAEQWMMYQKALLFGDEETAELIMKADHPREQQALGRKVKGFNQEDWNANARNIVYLGNKMKYEQSPKLWLKLKETVGTTLVEASPYDCVWGIGWTEDNPKALSRDTWRGTNWLGECVTRVRDDLLAKDY